MFDALATTGGRPAASMAGKQMIDEPPTTAVMMPPRKPVPARKKAVRASMRMGAGLLRFPSLAGQVHRLHQAGSSFFGLFTRALQRRA